MYKWLKPLLITTAVFLGLDTLYLNTTSCMFGALVQRIQKAPMKLNPLGAVLCYVALITGIYYFIIKDRRSVFEAGLLGLIIYVVFETTNYAMFKDWSMRAVVLDSAWGSVLFALTTWIVYKLI